MTATSTAVPADAESQREADKGFSSWAAKFALAGWQLWRTDAADGPVRYFAARWGRVTEPMGDLAEVARFHERITGRAG